LVLIAYRRVFDHRLRHYFDAFKRVVVKVQAAYNAPNRRVVAFKPFGEYAQLHGDKTRLIMNVVNPLKEFFGV